MTLVAVGYDLSTSCTHCRRPLALNGAAESFACPSCQKVVETPQGFWVQILSEHTGECLAHDDGFAQGWTTSLVDYPFSVKGTFRRQSARCGPDCGSPFGAEDVQNALASGREALVCAEHGKELKLRRPPSWFLEVHPAIVALVGETHAMDKAPQGAPASPRFQCNQCGAALPLDGKSRSVKCSHCGNATMVPDEIWVRLHPAATASRWYALIDVGQGVRTLPEDCADFCGLAAGADGRMFVAWLDEEEGDAGHPCRIAALDPTGTLVWLQDGVVFSDDARLLVSPADGTVLLVDPEEGFLRALDPRTGRPIRTIPAGEADRDASPFKKHDGVAPAPDGSIVVRSNSNSGTIRLQATRGGIVVTGSMAAEVAGDGRLLRMAADGSLLPLWPQKSSDGSSWSDLADRPQTLPDDSLFGFGGDGLFYVIEEHARAVARFDASGRLLGKFETGIDYVDALKGFGVARDGTIYVVFEHETPIGDQQWAHVARIRSDGSSMLWLGPHAPGNPVRMTGQYDDQVAVLPDGSVLVGSQVHSLRLVGPDGDVRWRTNATRREDSDRTKHLAELRRGKKVVEDDETVDAGGSPSPAVEPEPPGREATAAARAAPARIVSTRKLLRPSLLWLALSLLLAGGLAFWFALGQPDVVATIGGWLRSDASTAPPPAKPPAAKPVGVAPAEQPAAPPERPRAKARATARPRPSPKPSSLAAPSPK